MNREEFASTLKDLLSKADDDTRVQLCTGTIEKMLPFLDGDDETDKLIGFAGLKLISDMVGRFVPNFIAGIARGAASR